MPTYDRQMANSHLLPVVPAITAAEYTSSGSAQDVALTQSATILEVVTNDDVYLRFNAVASGSAFHYKRPAGVWQFLLPERQVPMTLSVFSASGVKFAVSQIA